MEQEGTFPSLSLVSASPVLPFPTLLRHRNSPQLLSVVLKLLPTSAVRFPACLPNSRGADTFEADAHKAEIGLCAWWGLSAGPVLLG